MKMMRKTVIGIAAVALAFGVAAAWAGPTIAPAWAGPTAHTATAVQPLSTSWDN